MALVVQKHQHPVLLKLLQNASDQPDVVQVTLLVNFFFQIVEADISKACDDIVKQIIEGKVSVSNVRSFLIIFQTTLDTAKFVKEERINRKKQEIEEELMNLTMVDNAISKKEYVRVLSIIFKKGRKNQEIE